MFEDLCTNPDYGKELKCVYEPGNLSDPYVVAVKKEIYGDAVIVATSISPICSIFIRRGGVSHIHPAATHGFF